MSDDEHSDLDELVSTYEECIKGLRKIVKRAPELSSKLPQLQKLDECIMRFCDLTDTAKTLIEAALQARLKAYCPYSNFKVGAAFQTRCGSIYTGCNIENVAFTPGCCAERCALLKAISEGHKNFSAGAVVAYHKSGFTTPCGVCRQFIIEHASRKDMRLYVAIAGDQYGEKHTIDDEDQVLVTSIYNLLPHSFTEFQ